MRIAVPIHSFEPGGVERVALRLARKWQDCGQDVEIVLGRDRGVCRDDRPDLDYVTRPEPISTASWETLWLIWHLWHYLRQNQVNVIFCAGNTYTIVCVAMRVLLGKRCPPVLVKISNDVDRKDFPGFIRVLYRQWLRIQGKLLDHFVALGDPMKPEIVRELGIAADRVTTIPDPALAEAEIAAMRDRPASSPGNRGVHVVSLGRLAGQKNYPLLVEAFLRFAGPDDRLTIAGEGPGMSALERQIAAAGAQDRVVLAGHVSDIAGLLATGDVFALSSDYEGVPAVIVEALAAGLPLAVTNSCVSMPWLLQNGRFGALAKVGDADDLASAIRQAASIAPPVAEMRAFASRFTLEQASDHYLALLSALADRSRVERPSSSADSAFEMGGNGI